jgi:hypothetical protein
MTKHEKIDYVTAWKRKNKHLLNTGSLALAKGVPLVSPLNKFIGIFFSMSAAQKVVPNLQRVFQADTCHTSFGKYTLYLFYGMPANCSTSPVAFGILFGNKDKEGWVQFWIF